MPKDRRQRVPRHDQSARLSKRTFVSDTAPELVEVGRDPDVPADELLTQLKAEDTKPILTKKEKQQLKHDAFIQRLGLSSTPYSKSHARRLKRKAREQIASGLDDVVAALPPIIANAEITLASSEGKTNSPDAKSAHSNKRQAQNGLIGEGKGAPLSKNQRKNVLKTEKMRQSLLLATPEFKNDPFRLLRIHAQNTLIKHDSGAKPEME